MLKSNYGKEKGWMNEPIKHKCLTGKIKPSCLTPLAAASYYTDLNLVLWGRGGGGGEGGVWIVFTSTPCMYRLLAVDLSYSDSRSVGLGRAVSLQEPWTVKGVAHRTRSAAPHRVMSLKFEHIVFYACTHTGSIIRRLSAAPSNDSGRCSNSCRRHLHCFILNNIIFVSNRC